jgi:hypothetical protein
MIYSITVSLCLAEEINYSKREEKVRGLSIEEWQITVSEY